MYLFLNEKKVTLYYPKFSSHKKCQHLILFRLMVSLRCLKMTLHSRCRLLV